MLPDHRFQHHGEPVETREQWAARQAAAVHAQELAAAQRRQAAAAVEAKRRELEAATAKRTEAAPSRRVPVSGARSPATGRRSLVVAGLVVLCLTSGILAWSLLEPSPPAAAADADPSTAIFKSKRQPEPSRAQNTGKPDSRSVEREARSDVRRGASWADAPTIAPQSDGWWCLCYKTHTGADHTACRRLPQECAVLLEMVETQGTSSIRVGSVSALGCRYVPGPYPWIRLGHRSAWTTSSFAGATQAPNVCAL